MNPHRNIQEKFLPLDELMAKNLPPIEWLIEGIIPEEGVTIMAAKPSSLKTWAALQMAIDIASGDKFLGNFKTKQSPVLILDGESGERLLKNRMEVLGAPKELPIYYQSYSGGAKFDKDFFEDVVSFCAEKGIKLVIFDSLIRFMDAKDENSATEVSNAFKRFSRLKTAGVSVLIIHHSRKGSNVDNFDSLDSVRGSGDIIAACDVGIVLFGRKKNTITIRVGKNRYDEEMTPFKAEFRKESDKVSRWLFIGSVEHKSKKSDVEDTILDIIKNGVAINQKNIMQKIRESGVIVGNKKVCSILDNMVVDGQIICEKGNRTEKVYRIKGEKQNGQT